MKKFMTAFGGIPQKAVILLFILISAPFLISQTKHSKGHPDSGKLSCKTCHACDVPTQQDPCLISCPRNRMVPVNEEAGKTVNVVTLDELSKKYMPVIFPHRDHAQMSEMSGGCVTCHHYNTDGPIQPCKNCHEYDRNGQDISKPDLEAAYHRQCINCHREWSHENNCVSCHALKTGNEPFTKNISEKKFSIIDHPKLTEPAKVVYETNYDKGKIVTFYHDEHTKIFGAECISCHKQENCTKCHDKNNPAPVQQQAPGTFYKIQKTSDQHHKPCFTCHKNDDCSLCHLDKPEGPFNHEVRTGWALNKFHQKLLCSKCHTSVSTGMDAHITFVKLDNKCQSCHKNFATGSFDHKLTGLKLDDNHKDLDCISCHENTDFSKSPTCVSCHDDKSFPKNKPGESVSLGITKRK
jgi:hypothetical protein